jgi:hypothetical protein
MSRILRARKRPRHWGGGVPVVLDADAAGRAVLVVA